MAVAHGFLGAFPSIAPHVGDVKDRDGGRDADVGRWATEEAPASCTVVPFRRTRRAVPDYMSGGLGPVEDTRCGRVVDAGRGAVRVQRVRVPDSDRVSYTVIDGSGLPVEAADVYLGHLTATGRSPYTVEAYAHDLRDFFEWTGQRDADFRHLGLEDLA